MTENPQIGSVASSGLHIRNLQAQSGNQDRLKERGIRVVRPYSASGVPILSIVIPMFNTDQWVGEAVRSALNQTLRDIEVIVVDDGSTDEGLSIVSSFPDPRLTILTQPNQGLSAARNSGILVSQAKLIGFLDADDIWFATKAEEHVALHGSNAEVGLTFSWSAYIDSSGRETGQFLTSRCGEPNARDLTHWNHVGNGSTPVVRRACFEQAGLFDEDLRSCEDLDMWVRIAAKTKFKLKLVPKVLTGYRVREGSLSLTFDKFMDAAGLLQRRFSEEIPGFDSSDGRRCFAQMARIASRKALADGQVEVSRKLLWRALAANPTIALTDVRALALIGIHGSTFWLPQAAAYGAYTYIATTVGGLVSRTLRAKRTSVADVH